MAPTRDPYAGKLEPKEGVTLAPPKYDPISLEELSKANGKNGAKAYVAIMGVVFDVSGNKAYCPEGSYHVFVGHDASYALANTSTKSADVHSNWSGISKDKKKVLKDWSVYFTKRYNIVGLVEGATNTEPPEKEDDDRPDWWEID